MMTPAITLDDALGIIHKNLGSAPKLLDQAKQCLAAFERQKDTLRTKLGELASIVRIDSDACEIRLFVYWQLVVGRFGHALSKDGFLAGQFAFVLAARDDSEQPLWAFTFAESGGTSEIAEDRRDEPGIGDQLVGDVLAHLIARVQTSLPRFD